MFNVFQTIKKIQFYITEPFIKENEKKKLMESILEDLSYIDPEDKLVVFEILINKLRNTIVPRLTDTDYIEIEKLNKKRLIQIKYLFVLVIILLIGLISFGVIILTILDIGVIMLRDDSIILDSSFFDLLRYMFIGKDSGG